MFAGEGMRFESHLGHVFSLFRGFLVFLSVHSVHTLASDLMFRVCGVPERPIRLWGSGRLRRTAYRPVGSLLGVHPRSSFPWVFRVHHFMVARTAYNMTC